MQNIGEKKAFEVSLNEFPSKIKGNYESLVYILLEEMQ